MQTKGILIQAGIIVMTLVVFTGLIVSPKKYSITKQKEDKTQETKVQIKDQITEVKNEMKPLELSIITGFEAKFEGSTGEVKIQWLDSIIGFWDGTMRPAISAVYAKDKAELTGKMEDYMMAGERFINVGSFLKPEDKPWAYDEAESIFEKILEKDPDNADAKINLGICKVQTNPDNPMEGIGLLREVVDKDPNNTKAILQLGHFSVLSDQYSKAIERYKQALEIDPNLTEAYFYLGDAYAKMDDMENAEKYLLIYRGLLKDEEVKKQLDIYLEDLKKMYNTKMN
jgi:tetratricopeptide (TPR) repeat protein